MSNKLEEHRETWKKKKILRDIYISWYHRVFKDLAKTKGRTIELGSGGGNFKEFKPDVVASDIDYCPWLDVVFDAHHIPLKEGSAGNIVMIDVLHHLADPVKFFQEAERILEPGGRIVIIEPFPTPFSLFIYKRFHPEPFLMDIDYFSVSSVNSVAKMGGETFSPWDSNQAISYLLFFKGRKEFERMFGKSFTILKRKRMSVILYPGSGGFENKSMIPGVLVPIFKVLEVLLTPFRRLLAFRCYIVLEKETTQQSE